MDGRKVARYILIALWIYIGLAFIDKFNLISNILGGPLGFRLRATWVALSGTVWELLFWLSIMGTISYLLWR